MKWIPLAAAALFMGLCAWSQQEPAPPVGTELAQPVPFSHRAHVATGTKCADCHKMQGNGTAAGIPAESLCMSCHRAVKKDSIEIAKVAEHARNKQPIRWARLYQLPNFVSFSHKRHHAKAGIACETCHGAVAESDVLRKEKPISMVSCMACHDARKASNNCDTCHVAHPG